MPVINLARFEAVLLGLHHGDGLPDGRTHKVPLEARELVGNLVRDGVTLNPDLLVLFAHLRRLLLGHGFLDFYSGTKKL